MPPKKKTTKRPKKGGCKKCVKRGGFGWSDLNPVNIAKHVVEKVEKDASDMVNHPKDFFSHPSRYVGYVPGVGTVEGLVAGQALQRVGLGRRKRRGGRSMFDNPQPPPFFLYPPKKLPYQTLPFNIEDLKIKRVSGQGKKGGSRMIGRPLGASRF